MKEKNIILLSTADWDNPFWTNKQHVAVELAKRGHRVFYINSLGLRQPSLNGADIKRIFKRLKRFFARPRQVRDNIFVWSPVVIPFQRFSWVRAFNKILLTFFVKLLTRFYGFKNPLLWTYNPLTSRLLSLDSFDFIIYHCVDEIKAQPGMPVAILENSEEELTRRADVVFVTAPKLFETRQRWNSNTWFFSNVADYSHFSSATLSETVIPQKIVDIPEPRLGFIGAISSYKVDFNLIYQLAIQRPGYHILMIGKVGEGDPDTNTEYLQSLPNIHFLGAAEYKELPSYLKGIDVALLPSNINEYTENMFPMKFFEYLAAGKPIVTTELPALMEFKHAAFFSDSIESFISNIDVALQYSSNSDVVQRQGIAKEFTYELRTEKMMNIISEARSERGLY